MRTLLLCHHDAPLDHDGLARWLGSFSDLSGIVIVREPPARMRRRIARERGRVGTLRFADVVAFRVYYALLLARGDRAWEELALTRLRARYPDVADVPVLRVEDPNAPEVERFGRERGPDVIIARVKSILKENIFGLARLGTFVMHPGICPEYRNAHGAFWALARGDRDRVGATLLRIDRGVDTGPVYGYYRYPYDAARESHVVMQHRAVLENLDAIRDKLLAIEKGAATPEDTRGRPSATWGQPWLTSYLRWRYRALRGEA